MFRKGLHEESVSLVSSMVWRRMHVPLREDLEGDGKARFSHSMLVGVGIHMQPCMLVYSRQPIDGGVRSYSYLHRYSSSNNQFVGRRV